MTTIVVEHGETLVVNQLTLFPLTNLSQQAVDIINSEEGIIAHEVIESFASKFLE